MKPEELVIGRTYFYKFFTEGKCFYKGIEYSKFHQQTMYQFTNIFGQECTVSIGEAELEKVENMSEYLNI